MERELQLLIDYENDIKWLKAHKEDVRKSHRNKFVAVKGSRIVEADANLQTLIEKLEKEGVDPADVLIEFIHEREIKMILHR